MWRSVRLFHREDLQSPPAAARHRRDIKVQRLIAERAVPDPHTARTGRTCDAQHLQVPVPAVVVHRNRDRRVASILWAPDDRAIVKHAALDVERSAHPL